MQLKMPRASVSSQLAVDEHAPHSLGDCRWQEGRLLYTDCAEEACGEHGWLPFSELALGPDHSPAACLPLAKLKSIMPVSQSEDIPMKDARDLEGSPC